MTHIICGYSIFSVDRTNDDNGGEEFQLWGARRHLLHVVNGRVQHESELLGPFRREPSSSHEQVLRSIRDAGVGESCDPDRTRRFKFWGAPDEEDMPQSGMVTGHVVDYDPRPRGGKSPPELVPLLCVSIPKQGRFGSREVMVRLARPGHTDGLKRDADPASQIRATFAEIAHSYRLESQVAIEPSFRRKSDGRPGGYWLLAESSVVPAPAPTKENLAQMAATLQGHFSPAPATAK